MDPTAARRCITGRIVLGLALLDFLALSAWAVSVHGYVGFFGALGANAATITASADLLIALGLITVWMHKHRNCTVPEGTALSRIDEFL